MTKLELPMAIKNSFREVTFQKFDETNCMFTVSLHKEKEMCDFHENFILNLRLRDEIKKTFSESKEFSIFADYGKGKNYICVSNVDNSLDYTKFWIAVHEVGHALMILHHKCTLSNVVVDPNKMRGITNQENFSNDRNQLDIHVAGDAATALFGLSIQLSISQGNDFEQFKKLSLTLNGSEVNIEEYNNHANEVKDRFLKSMKLHIYLLAIELLRSYVISGEDFLRMYGDLNAILRSGGR